MTVEIIHESMEPGYADMGKYSLRGPVTNLIIEQKYLLLTHC